MDADEIRGIQYHERWGGEASPAYMLAQIPPASRAQAAGVFKEWALVHEGRQGKVAEPHNSFDTDEAVRAWLRGQGLRPV